MIEALRTFRNWHLAGFLLATVAALAMRAVNIGRSFNIFIDEIAYLYLSQNLTATGAVGLYGKPFFLHPPGFFALLGGYLQLLQPAGSTFDHIYAARMFNVLFAALSAGLLLLIGWRLAGPLAGAGAAAMFVLDPFIVRMNSLVLLDTAAMFWVLLGYTLLLHSPADKSAPERLGVGHVRVILVGLCFGAAVLTKDTMAALTVVPMLICVLVGWALARRAAALIAVLTVLAYLPYPLHAALTGNWAAFTEQKLMGVQRLAGVLKITGLNRAGGPSLAEKVVERLPEFAPTYLTLALGVAGLVLLLLQRTPPARLLSVWMLCASGLLGYCIAFGTIEEQFFYWIVVSFIPAAAMFVPLARPAPLGKPHPWRQRATLALLAVFICWSTVQWTRVHFTPDNGYEQMLAYLNQHAQPHQKVASTSETGQFLLLTQNRASGPWGKWTSPDALAGQAPGYLLISELQLDWDHRDGTSNIRDWASQNGRLVFSFASPRNDSLLLYQLEEAR